MKLLRYYWSEWKVNVFMLAVCVFVNLPLLETLPGYAALCGCMVFWAWDPAKATIKAWKRL